MFYYFHLGLLSQMMQIPVEYRTFTCAFGLIFAVERRCIQPTICDAFALGTLTQAFIYTSGSITATLCWTTSRRTAFTDYGIGSRISSATIGFYFENIF